MARGRAFRLSSVLFFRVFNPSQFWSCTTALDAPGELHRPHRSTDELLQLVRAKTAKMGAKDYFRAVDTGRVNKIGPADFQEALRRR
eukprot:3615183-Pleurochrysis_carterae.AAC.7